MKKQTSQENKKTECCCEEKIVVKKNRCHCSNSGSNAIYGLGVIGALFYFLNNATSFSLVLIGIGKSIFWPAILMFELLTYLQL
ncbi:MAG: hypothetical protein PHN66_03050 [Candidatus Shapirobacteria bacterium]|nr:hypothetical protein [Candidatus Shapirobacteria bacterium]